jgi:hypothetical protein
LAIDLLPKSTVIYAEIGQPNAIVKLVQDHPLRDRVEALQGVKDYYESQQYLGLKAGVAIVEAKLGKTWPELLEAATDGGIALGLDTETQGVAVLAKANDEKTYPEIISTLVELARQDAKGKNKPDPIKSGEHRGITAYQVDQARVVAFGRWLLVTNNGDLGNSILDSFLDKPEDTLAANEQFKTARSAAPRDASAWAYVDVEVLRNGGIAKELFTGRTENPVAELLVGGLLDTLKQTSHATAALTLDAKHARLELSTPHQNEWVSEAREYFFGPEGKGFAPALLSVKNELLSLSTYRDFSTMWLRAGDLFDEKTNDGFAQADANLSTFFSGKDFGEDVLGAVEPTVQLVVARQTYAEDQPQPAIKIPSFALAFRLKDPETMKPDFRRTFTSLIGFLNVLGAMNGQPQLDLDIDKDGDRQLVTASYLPDKEGGSPAGLKIHYNFSPSVAFVGDRFIVSSTTDLANELSEILGKGQEVSASNSAVRTNLSGLRDVLADNRGQLVAQNMLEDGNTKDEAEREIDDILKLIAGLQEASLKMNATDGAISVALEVSFSDPE